MVIIAISFSTGVFAVTRKKDIKQATIQEISQTQYIDTKLATRIKDYAIQHNIKSVSQLKVKYVGDKRLNALEKKFK